MCSWLFVRPHFCNKLVTKLASSLLEVNNYLASASAAANGDWQAMARRHTICDWQAWFSDLVSVGTGSIGVGSASPGGSILSPSSIGTGSSQSSYYFSLGPTGFNPLLSFTFHSKGGHQDLTQRPHSKLEGLPSRPLCLHTKILLCRWC